ncbi:MAG: hypothetical protein JSR77_00900 [Planctomycetes bacterium]|nr:hypothetical protein [Planctomycetota bacterium]
MLRQLVVTTLVSVIISTMALAQCGPDTGDQDCDGIADTEEARLLQLFAPTFVLDTQRNGPREGVGIPETVTRLVQHAVFRESLPPPQTFRDYAFSSVAEAAAFMRSRDDRGAGLRARHTDGDFRWGYSNISGGESSWPDAIARNDGLYGRVWRPWEAYPDIYSVQYFVYLTWNETTVSGGEGNHEGDWLCVDFGVDLRANPQYPTILHAIYHNHGRQFFVEPRCLEFEDGHPMVYPENGVNEAWPARGQGVGWATGQSWPARDGFAANQNFDYEGSAYTSEGLSCRDHLGQGNRWETYRHSIKNIGEASSYNMCSPVGQFPSVRSLCGDEGTFLLLYQGRYGDRGEGDFYEGDPPRSPVYQAKLWSRSWKVNTDGQHLGPWAACTPLIPGDSVDPFDFPVQNCAPGDVPIRTYHYCLWSSPGHVFYLPPRPAVGEGLHFYVQFGGTPNVEGTSDRPYSSFEEAIYRVPQGSDVRMTSGVSLFRGSITKSLTLRSSGGPVTIGR